MTNQPRKDAQGHQIETSKVTAYKGSSDFRRLLMVGTPLVRWGLGLSAAVAGVVALAVVRFQQPLGPLPGPDSLAEKQGRGPQTYCYQGVRTHDVDQPMAQCFTVEDGKFTRVFPWDDASLTVRPGFVIPGIWDGHGHLLQYGEFLHSVDLFGASSLDDVRGRLRDYVRAHPEAGTREEWIRGVGWDQNVYGRMPTAVSHCPHAVLVVYSAIFLPFFPFTQHM